MKKLILLTLTFVFSVSAVHASVVMSAGTVSGGAKQTVTVGINIANDKPFVGFQFDVVFPSSLTYVSNSAQLTARANGQSIATSLVSPGRLRIIAYSITLTPFSGTSGAVATLDFTTGTDPGSYTLTLENAIVADSSQRNILTSSSNGTVTIQAPNIGLNPASLDFGSIPLNQRALASVTIHNSGNVNLIISKFSSDRSAFSLDDSTGVTISPSGDVTRSVYFQSPRKGIIGGAITISSNDPDSPTMKISVTAKAYAVNELHVGSETGRSGYVVTVPVSINDMEPLVGFQVQLQLPPIAKFISGSAMLTSRKADHVVSADTNGSVLTVISYSPTNKSFSGNDGNIMTFQLLIEGSGGDYGLPVQSAVISDSVGANIMSASYSGNLQIASPYLTVNSNSINYGRVSAKDTAENSFSITNNGNDTLAVTSLQISNPEYWQNLALPFALPPGQSRNAVVHFHSSVEGTHAGRITIRSNDYQRDPTYVDLSAIVYRPNIISVVSLRVFKNENGTLEVTLDNMKPIVAFQCDIQLPSSVTIKEDSVRLTSRKADHVVAVSDISSNKIRVISYSPSLKAFSGDTGVVLEIPLTAGDTAGTFSITLSNVIISDTSGTNVMTSFNDGQLLVLSRKITIERTFNSGWNLLSIPVVPDNWSTAVLFPDASSKAFAFQDRYIVADTLRGGAGYWLKLPLTASHSVQGLPVSSDTIQVNAGWNIVGSISDTVAVNNVTQSPLNIVSSYFFGFDRGYRIANSLIPASAYWVKTSGSGSIALQTNKDFYPVPSLSIKRSGRLASLNAEDIALDSLNILTIFDSDSSYQSLYFGKATVDSATLSKYELPPKPPWDAFDVRFSTDRFVQVYPDSIKDSIDVIVEIQSGRFPVTVAWNIRKSDASYFVDDGAHGKFFPVTPLKDTGRIIIRDTTASTFILRAKDVTTSVKQFTHALPDRFELLQNFPNPFNPSTTINYQMPVSGFVTLKVYDLLGREIATLADGYETVGMHSVIFDARSFPSGVYYYTFRNSLGTSSARKMILTK
jgi:hypothetical protein